MKIIQVKCVYFKPSGKWYSYGAAQFDKALFEGCIYPREYGNRLRQKLLLPGLHDGYWNGPFTVETEYVELVLPDAGTA